MQPKWHTMGLSILAGLIGGIHGCSFEADTTMEGNIGMVRSAVHHDARIKVVHGLPVDIQSDERDASRKATPGTCAWWLTEYAPNQPGISLDSWWRIEFSGKEGVDSATITLWFGEDETGPVAAAADLLPGEDDGFTHYLMDGLCVYFDEEGREIHTQTWSGGQLR